MSDREQSLDEIIDYIEAHYHAALRRDVPPLIEAAFEIERVHAGEPGVPVGLGELLVAFWDELQVHLAKEERIMFPALRGGAHGPRIAIPIRTIEREHEIHEYALRRVRELTGDLVAPAHARARWCALYDGLVKLERDLVAHEHLEHDAVFRRAVAA